MFVFPLRCHATTAAEEGAVWEEAPDNGGVGLLFLSGDLIPGASSSPRSSHLVLSGRRTPSEHLNHLLSEGPRLFFTFYFVILIGGSSSF